MTKCVSLEFTPRRVALGPGIACPVSSQRTAASMETLTSTWKRTAVKLDYYLAGRIRKTWRHTYRIRPTSCRSERKNRLRVFPISRMSKSKRSPAIPQAITGPILSVLPPHVEKTTQGRSVHWNVFTLFTELTFNFWETLWLSNGSNGHYPDERILVYELVRFLYDSVGSK